MKLQHRSTSHPRYQYFDGDQFFLSIVGGHRTASERWPELVVWFCGVRLTGAGKAASLPLEPSFTHLRQLCGSIARRWLAEQAKTCQRGATRGFQGAFFGHGREVWKIQDSHLLS